jgi:hypothetical protein
MQLKAAQISHLAVSGDRPRKAAKVLTCRAESLRVASWKRRAAGSSQLLEPPAALRGAIGREDRASKRSCVGHPAAFTRHFSPFPACR